jgi:Leucine-rich repeat (LRR) protein
MVCTGCKKDIIVPEISTATNQNLKTPPTPTTPNLPPNLPPTPPPTPNFNAELSASLDELPETKSDNLPVLSAVADAANDAETALLAAVFTDKIQDKREAAARAKVPPQLPTKNKDVTPEKKFLSSELIIIVTILLIASGAAVYFIFFFDWLGVDERVNLLKQIEERRVKTSIAIGNKDSEVEALRVQSLEAWTAACNAIDTFVMTMGDIDVKNRDALELDWNIALNAISESGKQQLITARDDIKKSIPAAETNLSKLKSQSTEFVTKAEESEQATDTAILDAIKLRAELKFYEAEIVKLKQQIADLPNERPSVSFPVFDKDSLAKENETTVKLNSDWTEEYYNKFKFTAVHQDNYFTTFDGMRRLFGNRSLRVTLFERMPITINFPNNNRTKNDLDIARTFNFAMRFPDLTDAIMVGEERDTGQFHEIRIRFINDAGHVEFKTKSREYCDAIFYSGRGKFVVIGFSLEGDAFWTRADNFDKVKLSKITEKKDKRELTDDEIKAMVDEAKASERDREAAVLAFFTQVDRVEFVLTPVSSRTTFWVDGIAVSGDFERAKIDLAQANSAKRELQKMEREIRKKRRQRSVMYSLSQIKGFRERQPDQADNSDNPPSTETNNENVSVDGGANGDGSVMDKKEFFKWITEETKGEIKARYRNRTVTFGREAKLPDDVESYEVEQISIANFKITETQLDKIVSFKTLKRLDLNGAGLRDFDLVKLSVLDSLEVLSLANNQLTFEALPALKTLLKLRELDLSGIRTSVKGIDSLGTFKSLVKLNLSNSGFDSTDLNYCVTLSNLEVLNLSGTRVGDRVTGIMQMLGKLREVDLSRTRISNGAIEPLTKHTGIEILRLDNANVDDNCLEAIGKITNLKSVSAKKTKITANGIEKTLNDTKIRFDLN